MKSNKQEKTQLMLHDLKVEIANIKKNQDPHKKTSYPKLITNRIKDILTEGVPPSLIFKITGVPITTLYSWQNKPRKSRKKTEGFSRLKIVNEIQSVPFSNNREIIVYLTGDIKLSIPLDLMRPMIKILKEEWHVSRN